MKKLWQWSYTGPKGAFHGEVLSVDPRDALSRTLTADTETGLLFGEMHGIPLDVLADAPGNADDRLEIIRDGFTLNLWQMPI